MDSGVAPPTRVREIEAKTLTSHVPRPGDGSWPWYRTDFNMNVYRGCQHRCIYCDSRSACYRIDRFDEEVLVKKNAVSLLEQELARKRIKGVVGTGSMSDPYMPLERSLGLMRRCLQVIHRFGFGVHVHTKSDLVVRDIDLLTKIRRISGHAVVAVTITTGDDRLAAHIEPYAPPPSRRFEALRALSDAGITTWITMMPMLPYIEDNEENLLGVVRSAEAAGVEGILPFLGVTLRDRQRAYFYSCLDRMFPGVRERYERAYGERYGCRAPEFDRLMNVVETACQDAGIETDPAGTVSDSPHTEQIPLL